MIERYYYPPREITIPKEWNYYVTLSEFHHLSIKDKDLYASVPCITHNNGRKYWSTIYWRKRLLPPKDLYLEQYKYQLIEATDNKKMHRYFSKEYDENLLNRVKKNRALKHGQIL